MSGAVVVVSGQPCEDVFMLAGAGALTRGDRERVIYQAATDCHCKVMVTS